ncbi:MAG: type II secretion system protein GspK [Candidatus Omnitrophica bacterium]|nr:type II secretion system protein GspK [Candidatus Omnitrophota bacterium]
MPKVFKGSILLIALWSLCLLSTFAVILGYGVRQKIMLASRLDDRAKLSLIAEAGIVRAIAEVKRELPKSYDAINDYWSINIDTFKDIPLGDGRFNVYNEYINDISGLMETRFGLVDEERKININTAESRIIKNILRFALNIDEMLAQQLAASIVDWRDSDSELSIPSGSAEDAFYNDLQYPYEAKDANFESLDELLLVKGITPGIFEKIKDYITIYGTGRVNVNTASKFVLLSVGFTEDIVDKIITVRSGDDGILGNADDIFFDSSSSVAVKLNQFYALNEATLGEINAISDLYLNSTSSCFMARSTATLRNKKSSQTIISVFDKDGKVLYWRES